MKNILRNSVLRILLLLISALPNSSFAGGKGDDGFSFIVSAKDANPKDFSYPFSSLIDIIYPKDLQVVRAVDSMFILGNVGRGFKYLKINGTITTIHEGGGFLAYIPVKPGEFKIHLELPDFTVYSWMSMPAPQPKDMVKEITVQIPEPLTPIPFDSLTIKRELDTPSGFLNLNSGDRLQVSFQGTPACVASFSIPGIADNIPMAETSPRSQPYWGESVFGVGAVPDSLLLKGIYTGYYEIPYGIKADSINVEYKLAYPSIESIRKGLLDSMYTSVQTILQVLEHQNDTATFSSSYKFSINNDEFPFSVIFTDSIQTLRHGPRKGYFSIFQPKGVEAFVTSSEGDWYIAELTKNHKAYINKNSVEKLPQGILPPHSYLSVIRCKGSDDNVKLEFPLSGKHPFKITELDRRTIKIQLYGVTTDTDWIRYDFSDKLIDYASWDQPEDNLYEFTIHLTKDVWGYDSYYEGNTFFFQLNKAPNKVKELKGKTIVIDPGHASDKGSIGPTGYTEAEANLGIALALEKELESKGVHVVMTRRDMTNVDLYDRPVIANAVDADLFISIHNNALPDGVNPFVNNGSSTYYYHTHSINLAKAIQNRLPDATKLNDYGLYHGNLAVTRPTQYPAILIENAFMIIPEQEALLKSDDFRKEVAKGITKGIEDFLKEYDHDNRK